MDDRASSRPFGDLQQDESQLSRPEIGKPQLCVTCNSILEAFESCRPATRWLNAIYSSSEALDFTANTDCRLCILLSNNLGPAPQEKVHSKYQESTIDIKTRVVYSLGYTTLRKEYLGFYVSPRDNTQPPYEAKFEVLLPSNGLPLLNVESLGTSTGNASSFNVALQWLDDCIRNHGGCHSKVDYRPTRLIDIGLGPTPTPSLVFGSELKARTKYLTLSHCWGPVMPKKLLRGNLSSMQNGFQVEEVPKTFQEAFIVTQRLGQRYIWIDSLCIMQDDLDDWRKESANMGQTYSNSLCNISATAAKDGSEGLFFDRYPYPMPQFQFSDKKYGTENKFYLWEEETWDESIEDAPLNQRGWVCQERFLSPCNLHFTSKQLFWECCQVAACEVFPEGFPIGLGPSDSSSKKHFFQAMTVTKAPSQEIKPQTLQQSNESWTDLITMYSKGGLTVERDKLVAISGLAAVWARINQDTYHAGLWEKNLPIQLLWRRSEKTHEDRQGRQYTAPSWSWAACDGDLEYSKLSMPADNKSSYLIEILDSRTELASGDPFGEVKGGYLVLKGHIAQAELSSLVKGLGVKHSDMTLRIKTSEVNAEVCRVVMWDLGGRAFEEAKSSLDELLDAKIVFLLPILNSGLTEGLVLGSTGKEGVFVRLGLFQNWDSTMGLLDEACKYFDTISHSTELERSTDENGDSKYTITLV